MRLKGISVIEQHIEKVVLAVMVLVLLGVVSMQFLYQPNMIEIGGRKVPPQAVFGELRKDVDRLKVEVDDSDPNLPTVTTPNLVEQYQQAISQSTALQGELDVAFGPAPRIGGNVDIGPVSEGPIMAMTVPAPANVLANSQWISADPYAIEDNPDLQAYLPPEQPYDIVGVSVAAQIDGKALQDLLRDGDGTHRPINSSWIRGGVAVLEVQAERQLFNPVSGSWGAAEAVERLPGSFDLMEGVKGEVTPTGLRDLVAEAEKSVDGIARPDYVPAIAGPEWLEPEKAKERDEQLANMSDVDLLRHLRKRALQRMEQNRKRLEETPGGAGQTPGRQIDVAPPPGMPGKGGGPGPMIDPGGGRNPQTDQRQQERQRQNEERRRAQIQKTIDDLQKEVEELEKELADRGFPVAGTETADANLPDLGLEEPKYLLGNEDYRIWAHDLNVQPGAVYRYRLRVKVNNPIFGKDRLLDAQAGDDLDLAKQPYAYSDWSAWSDDVIVGKDTYVFLTNGNESRSGGGDLLSTVGSTSAKVSAEVYHMYYGHYRRGSVTLTPGDSVYTDVRLPDKLYLFDTEVVSKDDAYRLAGVTPEEKRRGFTNYPFPTPMQAPPSGLPGQPGIPSRDPFVYNPEIQPAPGPAGRPGVQPPVDEDAPLPEGVTEAPKRITVTSGSILLDVVELPIEVPGGAVRGKPMIYAYFVDENGQVEYRRLDVDTQSREYELVRASYRSGEPEEEEEQPTP